MPNEIQDIYPLSPMQQGMLFHTLLEPGTGMYVEQLACTLAGPLDRETFARAWRHVLARHPVLRTSFVWEGVDEPLQVVHAGVTLPLDHEDWRSLEPEERTRRRAALLAEDRRSGFDLGAPPLLRLHLGREAEDRHAFVLSHHHLLLDGWSTSRVLEEVLAAYRAFTGDREPGLPASPPYRDYIAWLRERDETAAEAFWRAALDGFRTPTPLPPAPVGAEVPEPDAAAPVRLEMWLSREETASVVAFARARGLTPNTLVQGAWSVLLARHGGTDDVVFGATVSGRPPELPGVERMMGLFINTVPVRVRVEEEAVIEDWLKALQGQEAERSEHVYAPLVDIQGWSEVARDRPLFESLVVFENYPVAEALARTAAGPGGLAVEDAVFASRADAPLLVVATLGTRLGLSLVFDPARVGSTTARRFLDGLGRLIRTFAETPGGRVGDLPLTAPEERRRLLETWGDGDGAVDEDALRPLHETFAAVARRQPDAPALRFRSGGGRSVEALTYADLDARANRLARYLRARGVGPDRIVGLLLDHSPDLVVAVLAVLKAGGAWLPLDPAYPTERLVMMLGDSGAAVLVSTDPLLERLADGRRPRTVVRLDGDADAIAGETDTTPESGATVRNLCHVIYTSGSTGTPKGVLVEHRGVANFTTQFGDAFDTDEASRVLQFASPSFDAAAAEIVVTLLRGGTLVLAPREVLSDPTRLAHLIHEEAVTLALLPPAVLAVLPTGPCASLRTVVSAGERLPWEVAERWAAPGRRVINGYGPTEASIGATVHRVGPRIPGTASVPIGRPVPGVRVRVLDGVGRLVPVGVPGELYLGGVGLARGYHGRPELSAERFIPDPWRSGDRLYGTGDRVRWLPDGTLEFLGRTDDQIKLRGYRIELGEVEAALGALKGVRHAAAALRTDGPAPRLVGYVVLEEGQEADPAELRDALGRRLPAFMVPSVLRVLDALPVTPNGKLDRRALPAPEDDGTRARTPPRGPVEEVVAGLMAEVLGRTVSPAEVAVGREENFFESGGHSLTATRLVARVRDAFDVDLPLRALFESPTVAALAARVEAARGERPALPPLKPVERGDGEPLSFAQQRLWFLEQLAPGEPLYNNPTAVRVSGALDADAFRAALEAVVRRHEVLRATFHEAGGRPVVRHTGPLSVPLPVEDLSALEGEVREATVGRRAAEEAATPFDLRTGPLLRARLLRLADEEHVVLLVTHHIVSDGWSMNVLVRELGAFYEAARQGREAALPPLPVQYGDYAAWQRTWLEGEVLEQQMDYWSERLRGAPPLLELPTDHPRPSMQRFRGATYPFTLEPTLGAGLRALARREGATLFMALLAAWQAFLARISGTEDIAVGTPIANRTQAELEGLIGFFANTLVLRTDLSGDPDFGTLLTRARDAALGAYAHQDVPFEQVVETLQPERSLAHSPLFQVMLVFQSLPFAPATWQDVTFAPVEMDAEVSRFDLTLQLSETADGALACGLQYSTDLFEPDTMERWMRQFRTLLLGVVADPDTPLSRLPLLDAGEAARIEAWRGPVAPLPAEETVHALIDAVAARHPDAEALRFCPGGDDGVGATISLSYGELAARANRLAHWLIGEGVGPETLVGLAVERSPEMVVGLLGIVKAGGAWLPLDPGYPPERLEYMLDDAGVSLVLTQAHLRARMERPSVRVVCLDADADAWAERPATPPDVAVGGAALAYVIYTSGSTGQPKGVELMHRGAVNLATVLRNRIGHGPGDRVLQFSALSFDASVWEVLMALGSGASLVLAPASRLADLAELARVLERERVSAVTLPPSVLALLEPTPAMANLRWVVAAGEACSAAIVDRWAERRRFLNAYGPTEATVCATWSECRPGLEGAPPIGRALENVRLYVLDGAGEPVPVGVPGELWVGGAGVARGYRGRPEQTAERFRGDRFGGEPGARVYRTGDRVRWRPDGQLAFLGRLDDQVKVRGFRIEPGEVEAALRTLPEVADARVLARDGRLVACLLRPDAAPGAEASPPPDPAALQAALRSRLPEHMIPQRFVSVPAWPTTPSGKVDLQALGALGGERLQAPRPHIDPRTETEAVLAAECAALLELERVSVEDDFFILGGHSLLATQLVSRVRERFDVEIPLRTLFEHPTVAALARHIEAARQDAEPTGRALEMLKRLETLSEEEVRDLLEREAALAEAKSADE